MKEDEIDATQVGRSMDVLVAKVIFGWADIDNPSGPDYLLPPEGSWGNKRGQWYKVPHFSRYIEPAWQVIEKITHSLDEIISDAGEKYGYWSLDRLGYDCCPDEKHGDDGIHGQYRCIFSTNMSEDRRIDVFASADTAPLAICRAALKTKL
jgi:hypothetical protein